MLWEMGKAAFRKLFILKDVNQNSDSLIRITVLHNISTTMWVGQHLQGNKKMIQQQEVIQLEKAVWCMHVSLTLKTEVNVIRITLQGTTKDLVDKLN